MGDVPQPVGSHYVEEALYREAGVHNGPTIKPIELHIGIIEHMTPDMARIVGELSADKSRRGVERTLRTTGLVPPSRAFIAKHTTEMGIEIADQAGGLEQAARLIEIVPVEVASVSTGLDRMSVRMTEPADVAMRAPRREPSHTSERRHRRKSTTTARRGSAARASTTRPAPSCIPGDTPSRRTPTRRRWPTASRTPSRGS